MKLCQNVVLPQPCHSTFCKENTMTKQAQHGHILPFPKNNLIAGHHNNKKNQGMSINRRNFLQASGAGLVSLSINACGDHSDRVFTDTVQFIHGVASGDPLSDRVILWTRVTPNFNGKVEVQWEISTNESMTNIVNSGKTSTSTSMDYTLKVDADKLEPATIYYYRFKALDTYSPIGRTKTLPVGNVEIVKMVVFSCANYPAGYFHAYADAAKQKDIDVAIHLGDYIYEYGRYLEDNTLDGEFTKDDKGNKKPAYASYNAKKIDREVNPSHEITMIQDYRIRYAQYRTDKDLQALHAAMPMIAIWDDHEIANDSFKDGAENHQTKDGNWNERKLAAMTAYSEWLPIRNERINEVFRTFTFGNLLNLNMLDTRIFGRDKQLDYNNFIKPTKNGLILDNNRFIKAMSNPNRQMMGVFQQNWITTNMQIQTAKWQILGQQVLMARMNIPAPILMNFNDSNLGVDITTYMRIAQKAQLGNTLTPEEQSILDQPSIPYNLDAWDGYAGARENLLGVAKALKKNLVVLAGDTHNAWASDLIDHKGEAVGVEFATSSITSPGFEEYLPNIDASTFAKVLPTLIESGTLKYVDTSQRGYMVITVTHDQCQSDWVFVSDILKPEYVSNIGKTLSVKAGENKISL